MTSQIDLNARYYRVLHALFDGMNTECLSIVPLRTLKKAGIHAPARWLVQARLARCVFAHLMSEFRPLLPMISDYLEREKLTVIDCGILYDHGCIVPTNQQDRAHLYAAVGIDPVELAREQDELADSLRSAR